MVMSLKQFNDFRSVCANIDKQFVTLSIADPNRKSFTFHLKVESENTKRLIAEAYKEAGWVISTKNEFNSEEHENEFLLTLSVP